MGQIDEFSTDRETWQKLTQLEQLFPASPAETTEETHVEASPAIEGDTDERGLVPAPISAPSLGEWYYCSHAGKYGPFSEHAIRVLVEQGQIRDGDLVWKQGFSDWKPAVQFFACQRALPQPIADSLQPTAADGFAATGSGSHPRSFVQPDRGALIVALGLIGLFICGPLCLVAWVLGAGDLGEMRSGTRDERGRGATTWGMALGVIGTALWVMGAVYWLFVLNAGSRLF
ncbi:MAG: GYF domain-containing protein [Planctomycetaceae bacterium]